MLLKTALFLLFFSAAASPRALAQSYEELLQAVRNAQDTGRPIQGLSENQSKLRTEWETGKLIDTYLLERGEEAAPLLTKLTKDLNGDISKLYYTLQFARAYPDAPPVLDLHWGFYRYLLAINDARERNELAGRAFREKWNWDKLRAEVKIANQDNKEFVFTDTPGNTGVYRVVKAKRGPYRGELVLDLGFSNYYKLSKLPFREYEIVQAECRAPDPGALPLCKLHAGGRETDLFTYQADVIHVIDGDTFQALADLGFGVTTLQTFRLWGLDAPEINTKEGRQAKAFLESSLRGGVPDGAEAIAAPVLIRSVRMEKYGRYLVDVWSLSKEKKEPVYVNQALISRGLAAAEERW